MRRIIPLVIGVLGLVTAGFVISGSAHAATTTLVAGLLASNQVPPAASTATGYVTVTIDDTTDQVCVAGKVDDLSSALTLDHIHKGAAGTNGPVVVDFSGSLDTCVASTAAVVDDILADPAGFYFNVHTTNFPSGEVRGQLVTPQVTTLHADASAANEVPPVESSAAGPVTVTVDSAINKVCVDATGITGLHGIVSGSHIHSGAAGVNGPVVVNFNGQVQNCVIADGATVSAILANPPLFYYNVHTEQFGGGEARGQLAAQVTPTTTSTTTSTSTSTSTTSSTSSTSTTSTTVAPASTPVASPVNASPAFTG